MFLVLSYPHKYRWYHHTHRVWDETHFVSRALKDERDGRVPLLIIDGREITWEDFGRMLMSFEGWQFKLNIADKSEEL